ncbi:MAG: RNA polymerase sigma factor [Actinomycetota bacterium]|nr:RNA polymerase sigma factor [Actinomycetota bacterium]
MEIAAIEEETLAAALSGQEWAWVAIYRRLAPSVAGYLRAQGAPEPEDVAGEVFLQVVRAAKGFRGDAAAFRSWVFSIAHNKLVDARRRGVRRPASPVWSHAEDAVTPGNVEEEALGNLASGRVRNLIEKLTPDQAEVLLLRILGGLTLPEIALTVGKPLTAVKALQRRGVASLKAQMSREAVSV